MRELNQDLTLGKPESVLWKFCLPLFGSVIFQQLYNIADSLVAGQYIGENALAAVGNSYGVTTIFIAFAFGCNMGCSVISSQLFGAKRFSQMKTAVYTAMISNAVLCAALVLLGIVFCDGILAFLKTPTEILADSKLYLSIYIWGFPFLLFYNISTGIFTALGDSRTPFRFLAVSSTANILVDILFVAVLKMGVAGVAWATFLCQGVSCILAVFVLVKRLKTIHTEERVELFSFNLLKKIALIAIPSILQQSSISIGTIIVQSVINGFGAAVMAGYSVAMKLNTLMITAFTTFGNGISSYTAQNVGAGKLARVKNGFKAGVKIVWKICIPVVILYVFAGEFLIRMFMDTPSELAIQSGTMFLRVVVPFYFVISVKLTADGTLRGAGLMKQFMIATFLDLILRVVLAILFAEPFGYTGVWASWPIGWFLGTSLSVMFYGNGPWKEE